MGLQFGKVALSLLPSTMRRGSRRLNTTTKLQRAMNDIRLRKLVAVLSLFAASGALATTGYAQATTTTTTTATPTTAEVTAPAASNEEPTKMEQYVVTGSNIPQAADALSIPVAIIDNRVMEDSGIAADTLDLLRKVAPNISGIGSENAQIAVASNFRGANDPAEATGGSQFVDLNLIPPAAIDRVEVLEDGASAIYGSDAVGGVINIILKKDYNGWEMGAHYGFSTGTGRYEERSGYLVGGVSNGKTSITVSFDYAQHNALYLSSRPYTNPIYGTYTAPGTLEVYDNRSEE